jgi:hypothetical protein
VLRVIIFLHATATSITLLQGIEMHMSSGVEKVFVETKMFLFRLTGLYEVIKYFYLLGWCLTILLVLMPLNFSVARGG